MLLFVGHDDFAFELVSIANDFVNRRKFDKTVFDVLYAYHGRGYGCFDVASFKRKITVYHLAIDEFEILAIAKRLRSYDFAMFESYAVAIPRKILSLYDAIFDKHVFGVPESVLGVEIAILEHCVLDVLEAVFALEVHVFETNCRCAHHKILAFRMRICHIYSVRRPAEFGRYDLA